MAYPLLVDTVFADPLRSSGAGFGTRSPGKTSLDGKQLGD
jgi:hypothetical protein